MATQAQLRNKVLQVLGVRAAGQSVPAEDAAVVTEAYTSVHAQLLAQDVAWWAFASDIPDEALQWTAHMVAAHCASDFGVPPSKRGELFSLYQTAENKLRELSGEPYTMRDEPLRDY